MGACKPTPIHVTFLFVESAKRLQPLRSLDKIAHTAEELVTTAGKKPPIKIQIQFHLFIRGNTPTSRGSTTARSYIPGVTKTLEFASTAHVWAFFRRLHAAILQIMADLKKGT